MITTVLKLIIVYLLPWLFGYLVLVLADRSGKISRGLKFFAGFPVGMGIFTLEAFTAGIFGAKTGIWTFILILAVNFLVVGVFVLWRRSLPHPSSLSEKSEASLSTSPGEGRMPRGNRGAGGVVTLTILFFLFIKIASSFWQVLHIPTFEFDAWNNWNLRAKVIYTEQGIPLDKSDPFYLGGGIKSYPLNDGLWKVWVADMIGEWNENLTGLTSVVFYVVLLGLFYFFLPETWSRVWKIGATYLLASLPFLYFHSFIPYADLEFAVYLFLAVVSFFKLTPHLSSPTSGEELKEGGRFWLWLSAVSLALAIWTKNEGFAVVLPVIFAIVTIFLAAKKLSIRDYLRYWLAVIVITAPWLLFKFVNKLELLSGDSSTFHVVYNSSFLGEIWQSIFIRSHFNFLWLLVFVLIIFKAKKIWQDVPLRFLTIMLVALFLFYNGIILFTDKAYDLSALARVNLQIAPIAAFLSILLINQEVLDRPR